METLRPILGMALLGGLAGWLLGRLCYRAARVAVFVVLAVVALELIGYHVATMHWDALAGGAAAAVQATRSYGGVLWRLAAYNLPFTVGFAFGFWKALPPRRGRKQ